MGLVCIVLIKGFTDTAQIVERRDCGILVRQFKVGDGAFGCFGFDDAEEIFGATFAEFLPSELSPGRSCVHRGLQQPVESPIKVVPFLLQLDDRLWVRGRYASLPVKALQGLFPIPLKLDRNTPPLGLLFHRLLDFFPQSRLELVPRILCRSHKHPNMQVPQDDLSRAFVCRNGQSIVESEAEANNLRRMAFALFPFRMWLAAVSM